MPNLLFLECENLDFAWLLSSLNGPWNWVESRRMWILQSVRNFSVPLVEFIGFSYGPNMDQYRYWRYTQSTNYELWKMPIAKNVLFYLRVCQKPKKRNHSLPIGDLYQKGHIQWLILRNSEKLWPLFRIPTNNFHFLRNNNFLLETYLDKVLILGSRFGAAKKILPHKSLWGQRPIDRWGLIFCYWA